MTEGTEAAADILTGAVVAGTVEGRAGAVPPAGIDDTHGRCRNCGALLTGSYCAACGQPARIHRSLASLGHDILHFVFHFEGKLWRTLPELVIHPGRLTRRYVGGERAKFISPMALYLFMVFLMYAVFSLTGGAARNTDLAQIPGIPDDSGAAFEEIEGDLADLQEQLGDAQLSGERRAELVQEIADLETSRAVMEALAAGDLDRVEELEREAAARRSEVAEDVAPDSDRSAFENRAREVLKDVQRQPGSADLQAQGERLQILLGAGAAEHSVHVAALFLAAGHPRLRSRRVRDLLDQLHDAAAHRGFAARNGGRELRVPGVGDAAHSARAHVPTTARRLCAVSQGRAAAAVLCTHRGGDRALSSSSPCYC